MRYMFCLLIKGLDGIWEYFSRGHRSCHPRTWKLPDLPQLYREDGCSLPMITIETLKGF